LFPKSETFPGGLSPLQLEITASHGLTVFSFTSEKSEKRISLITNGQSSMTMLDAAKLCQRTVKGGDRLRLFTWESRQQLEEVGRAMNAVQVRYFGGRSLASLDNSGIWVNLFHPPEDLDSDKNVAVKDRAWYRLPADVGNISLDDMKNVSAGIEDGRVPASFMSTEVTFQSFAPSYLNSGKSGICVYLLWATSNIRRTAWLRDYPCDMQLDREVTWAACENY
jgi:hypothetical protein